MPASAEYISLIWQLVCLCVLANAHKCIVFPCVCIGGVSFVFVSSEASSHRARVFVGAFTELWNQQEEGHVAGEVRGRE